MKSSLIAVATGLLLALSLVPVAGALQPKTVNVVMHDPGCHWFSTGGKFTTRLTIRGPVALANFDEAALKVVGPKGTQLDPVGKKVILAHGSYKITMVGQAADDNHLRLIVT
jgi:hypothetical protein